METRTLGECIAKKELLHGVIAWKRHPDVEVELYWTGSEWNGDPKLAKVYPTPEGGGTYDLVDLPREEGIIFREPFKRSKWEKLHVPSPAEINATLQWQRLLDESK